MNHQYQYQKQQGSESWINWLVFVLVMLTLGITFTGLFTVSVSDQADRLEEKVEKLEQQLQTKE